MNFRQWGLPERLFAPFAAICVSLLRHLTEAHISAAAIAKKLGGRKVLLRDVRSELDLAAAVRAGLPSESLDRVLDDVRSWAGSQAMVFEIVGRPRTLERKTGGKKRLLKPAESDRLARLTRLIVRAEEAIGNLDKAHRWLLKGNRALDGHVPLQLLDSDAGTLAVERVLGRIEHGVFE